MCNGAIAIRFYRGNDGEGFARAWIVRLDEGLVVFNAYGLPCRTIAYVLSTLFCEPLCVEVDIRIVGDPSALIWLNDDAYAIGGGIPNSGVVGLSFDVPYVCCERCDTFVHTERYLYGEEMCEICYEDL